jgi:hypothetical protein
MIPWRLIGALVVSAIALLAVVLFLNDPFGFQKRALASAKAGKAEAEVAQVYAEGETRAGQGVAAEASARARREAITVNIHTDNVDALQAAPSDDLNRVGIVGMCRYPEYRDRPACVQLREAPGPSTP